MTRPPRRQSGACRPRTPPRPRSRPSPRPRTSPSAHLAPADAWARREVAAAAAAVAAAAAALAAAATLEAAAAAAPAAAPAATMQPTPSASCCATATASSLPCPSCTRRVWPSPSASTLGPRAARSGWASLWPSWACRVSSAPSTTRPSAARLRAICSTWPSAGAISPGVFASPLCSSLLLSSSPLPCSHLPLTLHPCSRWGRLRCLQMGYLGAAACTLGFAAPGVGSRGALLLLLLGFLQGMFVDLCWCNLYIYLTERFPSTIRNTGFGLSMGCGRAGGVLSAALGGLMRDSRPAAFIAFGLSFAVGGCVACVPRVETSRRALVDSVGQGKAAA